MQSKMREIAMKWKEGIIGGILGGLIAGSFSLVTTYMVISSSFDVQSRAVKYGVLKGHKKNYLNLIACKDRIKIKGLEFSHAIFVNPKSEQSYAAFKEYNKSVQLCVADIVAYNLQLEAVKVKSKLSSCLLAPLSKLSNNISDIYASDKQMLDAMNKLDVEIYDFPNCWDKCLEKLNQSLLELSKDID